MSQRNQTFKAADLSKRFKVACIQFDTLLASANSKELAAIRQKLRDGLQEYKQQGALTVAFIGQYSAGKSTIISALTGQRDIHIDADVEKISEGYEGEICDDDIDNSKYVGLLS